MAAVLGAAPRIRFARIIRTNLGIFVTKALTGVRGYGAVA